MGGLGAFVIIIILVVYAYVQKRKDNRIITKQKNEISSANEDLKMYNEEILTQRDEIEAQRDEIEAQRDHVINQKKGITDSINYAKRIQSAILPPETYITELLHENFIFFLDHF
jgi:F0F1-type ATP synthase membrane subunit b/b'